MQNIGVQNYSLMNTSLLNNFSWYSMYSRQLHLWHCGMPSSTVTCSVLYTAQRINFI